MKFIRIAIVAVSFGFLIGFSSCKKDSPAPTPTIQFTSSLATYAEDKGTVNIEVSISAKQNADVLIPYTWSSTDTTTYLGGDFTFTTPTPLTIPAGETTANIVVQIVNDTQVDGDDVINIKLAAPTGTVLNTTKTLTTYALTITDNDVEPTADLQIDLTWKVTDLITNINGANCNLYLQQNVKYTATAITDNGTSLHSSKNTSGFESLTLLGTDPDQVYWVVVEYAKGTAPISYLNFGGFDGQWAFSDGTLALHTFASADVGHAIFYGPFTKTGPSFQFTGRLAGQVKPKIYPVNNFIP